MLKDYFKKLYTGTQATFFDRACQAMDEEKKLFVITANPETMMIGTQTPEFDQVLCSDHSVIVPDGIGVVKAASTLGLEPHGRVTGVELAACLIQHAGETGRRIYLYGAKEEVVSALVKKISDAYSPDVVAGYHNGYGQDDGKIFEEIRQLKPDVVLVALGIPRQELLINQWFGQLDKGIFVGVGGSFDVLSDTKKRAPQFFVRLNLEWLYRIVKEPSRFGRFYRSNIRFLREIRKIKKQMGK